MLGKTNLTFISKGDASNVQLIQNSYVTGASGEIFKMEVINNKLFVFADKCYVLTGPDMDHLEFIKKDNENLQASHIVYAEGNYYIMSASGSSGPAKIFATVDFNEYTDIGFEAAIETEGEKFYNGGMFLDSKGNIITAFYTTAENKLYICICKSLKDYSRMEIVKTGYPSTINAFLTSPHKSYLVNDKIFMLKKQYSLSGTYVDVSGLERYMYTYGYFFKVVEEQNPNTNKYEKVLYRSRDGVNMIRYNHELPKSFYNQYVIAVNGKCCCIYSDGNGDCYLNIADDILGVGYVENQTLRVYDPMTVGSVLEYDGKTYIGTNNGIIYEFQLDYEGTLQRPDVTVIKTLAAKQALTQAVQYTDDCINELKNYIDQKIKEDNSTSVESEKNGS